MSLESYQHYLSLQSDPSAQFEFLRMHEPEVLSGYVSALVAIRAADEILARRNGEVKSEPPKEP